MKKLIRKTEWTLPLMEAFAFMGRVIKNYLKMKKIEKEARKDYEKIKKYDL